jgi:hypothetical protein
MNFTLLDNALGRFLNSAVRKILPERGGWFVPSWYTMGQPRTEYISTADLWQVYSRIPHLNNVINKRAEIFSQGKIKLVKIKDGSEVTEHPVLKLLARPNPLQSQHEFLTMYLTFKDIYANVAQLQNKGLPSENGKNTVPQQLWNLPPALMQVITTGQIYRATSINDIIKEYKIYYGGDYVSFNPNEIIFKNDNLGTTYVMSESKIIPLTKPLSNIEAALRTANVLIGNHGAYGIISSEARDQAGAIPLTKQEREQLEMQHTSDYGNKDGQRQLMITNAALKYTPIGSVMTDMMLDKEIEQDFQIICAAYSMDRDVFPTTSGATFENKKQGLISTIQNAIQSEADDLMGTYNERFGLTSEGLKLIMCYDHLPVMQEDKERKANVLNKTAQTLCQLVINGILTPAQAQANLKTMTDVIVDDKLAIPDDSFMEYREPKENTNITQNEPAKD